MFWHNFKYSLTIAFRVREITFWLILFPIVLGTCFKLAFGNIYNEDIKFKTVDVAVVEENGEDGNLRSVLAEMSKGDDALLRPVYTDGEEALKKLENEDVKGIIYANEKLSLTVASNSLKSTILEKFVEKYNLSASIIMDTMEKNPEKLADVAKVITEEVNSVKKTALSKGNTNIYDQYFYNLIAMVALFGSMAGLHVATENQGNLSALGARKCVSPTPKSLSISAALLSTFLLQTICMVIAVTYIHFGLKVDMGDRLGLFYLTAVVAGFVGSAMGFAIGSVGKAGADTKNSILTGVSLLLCFFSGLMDGNMKWKVAETAPWFNKINPAAVICESLFCLNVYEDYERYGRCMLTMIIMIIALTVLGFVMTRRRKYASL